MAADDKIAVSGLVVTGGARQNTLRWQFTNGSCLPVRRLKEFIIRAASSNDRAKATEIGRTISTQFIHSGLPASVAAVPATGGKPAKAAVPTSRWYWVQAVDVSGNLGDFYPAGANAGIKGTTDNAGITPGEVQTVVAGEIDNRFGKARIQFQAIEDEDGDVISVAIQTRKNSSEQWRNGLILRLTEDGVDLIQEADRIKFMINGEQVGLFDEAGHFNVGVLGAKTITADKFVLGGKGKGIKAINLEDFAVGRTYLARNEKGRTLTYSDQDHYQQLGCRVSFTPTIRDGKAMGSALVEGTVRIENHASDLTHPMEIALYRGELANLVQFAADGTVLSPGDTVTEDQLAEQAGFDIYQFGRYYLGVSDLDRAPISGTNTWHLMGRNGTNKAKMTFSKLALKVQYQALA